jgi:hypothetical protein
VVLLARVPVVPQPALLVERLVQSISALPVYLGDAESAQNHARIAGSIALVGVALHLGHGHRGYHGYHCHIAVLAVSLAMVVAQPEW